MLGQELVQSATCAGSPLESFPSGVALNPNSDHSLEPGCPEPGCPALDNPSAGVEAGRIAGHRGFGQDRSVSGRGRGLSHSDLCWSSLSCMKFWVPPQDEVIKESCEGCEGCRGATQRAAEGTWFVQPGLRRDFVAPYKFLTRGHRGAH